MDCGWLWSYKFIGCNKCTTPVRDIDNGGGDTWVGAEHMRDIFVSYTKFFLWI